MRQRLHFAQAAVHLLQTVRHQLERFAQALLQRGVQLFVDGAAHLVELGGVVGLDVLELLLQRGAHLGQTAFVALAQLGELLLHRLAKAAQRVALLFACLLGLLLQALAHGFQLLGVRLRQLGELLRERVDLVVLQRGDAGELRRQHLLELPQLLRDITAADACRLGNFAAQFTLDAFVAARKLPQEPFLQRRKQWRHIVCRRARDASPDQHTQHGHDGHAKQRQ